MKTFARVGLAAVVLAGVVARLAAAPLTPATFDEYVGIAGYVVTGASLSVPESVNLTVTQAQTGNLGSGTAVATASGVLPLVTELDLSLSGGINSSVIGGTAIVQTQYWFSVDPQAGGLPEIVPITLSASGWVTVDTSLPDGFAQGVTMARIMYPGGQVQADNEDAYGGHEGYFSFDQTIPLNVAAATAQRITIYLSSHGQALGLGPDFFYHGHAFLDPVIAIDPNFEFKDQFQVVYSQGIVVPHPGDANHDNHVNVDDLGILASNYDTYGGAVWETADFTGDGNVNVDDLGILASNYDWVGPGGVSVPEPATLSLLALGYVLSLSKGGVALMRRNRGNARA